MVIGNTITKDLHFRAIQANIRSEFHVAVILYVVVASSPTTCAGKGRCMEGVMYLPYQGVQVRTIISHRWKDIPPLNLLKYT